MSPDDEDTATEVSEGYGGTGPSVGQGTDDTGASQEFSDVDVEGFTDSMEEAMGLYGASAIGKGMSQAQFNAATGRTNYNPHPNSFFSQLFGRENVDYTAQYGGPQGVAALNAIALDVYNNPIGAKGNVRGAVGQDTFLGKVISVDRKQGPMETIGRSLFGLTPLGPLTSFLGTTEKSIAPIGMDLSKNAPGAIGTGYNYDPSLDPNNPAYGGPQSMLGQFGKSLEQITFGGARPVTESAKGIMSLYEAQDAKRAMGGYETFDGQKM
tara:strand:- start:45 stop:845 length:801 start_codon:yes stop_codon:yes gene_type:complete